MRGNKGLKRTSTGSPSYRYIKDIGRTVKYDMGRYERKGFPEVVFSVGKSDDEILRIVREVVREGQPVVISRLESKRAQRLLSNLKRSDKGITTERKNSVLFASPEGWIRVNNQARGRVAIVTAGSSDVPVASETSAILEMLGYACSEFLDCGIAGLHRTLKAAEEVIAGNYAVAAVFAGMEGALASVFASLVPIPVIGVPTSNGYGHGGSGEAALSSMLQSCVPGLVAVNIDNSVGAAAAVVSILGHEGQ